MPYTTDWVITDACHCLEEGQVDRFFEYVDEDVEWTVMGAHTLAGTYHGKASFRAGPFVPLNHDLKEGAAMRIRNQIVAGNSAVIEMESIPTDFAHKKIPNAYCWVLEVADGLIVRVRAYVDAALMQKMLGSSRT